MLATSLIFLAQSLPPSTTQAADDDAAPGFLIIGAAALLLVIVVIVVGVVIAVIVAAVAATLIGLGIISASALIAIVSRRWSAGIRAMGYQISAVGAALCGVMLVWLFNHALRLLLSYFAIAGIGLIAGAAGGLTLAFVLDQTLQRIARYWKGKREDRSLPGVSQSRD